MMSLIFFFFLCVALSAFFSGSEMAFVSANKLKLREAADQGDAAAKKTIRLQESPQHFLTVILIGNNLVNVAAASIVGYLLNVYFGLESEWLVTAIVAPLVIIFGETLPKNYCRIRSQNFLSKYGGTLEFLVKIMRPLVLVVLKAIDFVLGPSSLEKSPNIFVSEKEFRLMIEESTHSGVIERHEKRLIDTILDFERIQVESVMTPVEKVPKIEISETLTQAKGIARETHSRMMLVYEEVEDIIVGMVYVFDLLFEAEEMRGLKKYLRSPLFISRTTSLEKAFLTLQEKRQSFAAVTNVEGEVVGVVAIEKLVTR